MFENINEIFEHLEFDKEKGIRLLRILTTAGFSMVLYEYFGGLVVFPKDLTIKHIADFFFSFQFFIPVLFYYLSWILFKVILPIVLNAFTRLPFEFIYYKKILKHESNTTENAQESDVLSIIDSLTSIPTFLGGQKIDFYKWIREKDIDEEYEEINESANDGISNRIEKIIFFIQLTIIYYTKLQHTIVFNGFIDTVIQTTFIITIIFNFILIIVAMFFQKLFRVLYKMLKKYPKIYAKAETPNVST